VQQLPRGMEEFLGVTGSTASAAAAAARASMERIPRFATLGSAADAQIDRYRYPLYKRLSYIRDSSPSVGGPTRQRARSVES
jgi:hypothetical protein